MRPATLDEQAAECREVVTRLENLMYTLEAYQQDLNLGFSDGDIREMLTDAKEELDRIEELQADAWARENDSIARDYDKVRM